MNPKLHPYFLIAFIAVAAVLTFFIFRPFLVTLVLAAVFAVVLQPLYCGVLRRMHGSPGLAAFLTMLITLVCVLIPFLFISVQIVGDAQSLYVSLSDGSAKTHVSTVFEYASAAIAPYIPGVSVADLSAAADQYIKNGLSWLIQNVGGAFGGVARFLASLFIFLIALYYFLRDGARIKHLLIKASPLADSNDEMIFARLGLAVNSVIRGSLMIALIQGILTGIGFTLFGVPNSILWGVVAALAALIPGIGTSLVLIPGIAYLFIVGATTPMFGLLIWSVVAVGLIDNLLGPKLVGKGMQLHPLVVLLSVFGGLKFFGAAGVFLGPLCVSLLFTLLSIREQVSQQE